MRDGRFAGIPSAVTADTAAIAVLIGEMVLTVSNAVASEAVPSDVRARVSRCVHARLARAAENPAFLARGLPDESEERAVAAGAVGVERIRAAQRSRHLRKREVNLILPMMVGGPM